MGGGTIGFGCLTKASGCASQAYAELRMDYKPFFLTRDQPSKNRVNRDAAFLCTRT